MRKNEYMEKVWEIETKYEGDRKVERAMRNYARAVVLENTPFRLPDGGDEKFYSLLLSGYLTEEEHALYCCDDYRKL
jgi:hypothetical protein